MKTAYLLHDNMVGFVHEGSGLARCYKLSEPTDFDGDGISHEYAIVRVSFARENISAQIAVLPGTETGAVADRTLNPRLGSMRLKGCPKDNPAYIEGCFTMALAFNDFTIVDPPEGAPSE